MADKPDEKKSQHKEDGGGSDPNTPEKSKRARTHSEGLSDADSPRLEEMPLMVAASPPKFVSMEEIMSAAAGVSNMALAHEIAVDADFKINPVEPPPNSLARNVKEVMQRAFWDALDEKLKEDPPDLSHAVVLLQEVKQKLFDLLLPQHQKIRQQIDEVLDMELIEQKAEHGAIDFHYYAEFIISLMAKLCAPARDEQIAQLTQIKDVVPLFKEVFAVLDLLKVDMANFTIQQIRPYIQQQSAQYEKIKFDEFLKQQKEKNIDGLQFTKSWLDRNYIVLKEKSQETSRASSAAENLSGPFASKVSPNEVLTEAYIELLQWDFEHLVFPETVLMDESRLVSIAQKVKWLSLVSSVLLVTYNTVGGPLAGMPGFKEKLRDSMQAILAGVPESKLKEAMQNVAVQVKEDVQKVLSSHDFAILDDARQAVLKGQIEATADPQQTIRKLMTSRILGFLRMVISHSKPQQVQIPPGLSAVSKELNEMTGSFLRLVNHNRNVFGAHYAEITKNIISKDLERSLAEEVD